MNEVCCSTFYCDVRGGRYCCAFCPNPCKNRCLNHPDRCKLAGKRPPSKRKTLPEAQVEELHRMLKSGAMTYRAIAAALDISIATVNWHASRLREKGEITHGKERK